MSKLFKLFGGKLLSLGSARACTLGLPIGVEAEEHAGFYN